MRGLRAALCVLFCAGAWVVAAEVARPVEQPARGAEVRGVGSLRLRDSVRALAREPGVSPALRRRVAPDTVPADGPARSRRR